MNLLQTLSQHADESVVVGLAWTTDKLEDMDVSLNFAPFPSGAIYYFHVVTMANPMKRISSMRYQIKYINMIFSVIPQKVVSSQWCVKVGGVLAFFFENGHFHSAIKIVMLITYIHIQEKASKKLELSFSIYCLKCWPMMGS